MTESKLAIVGFFTLIVMNLAVFYALSRKSPKRAMNWSAILLSALIADLSFHVFGLAVDAATLRAWMTITIPAGAAYAVLVSALANVLLVFVWPRLRTGFDRRRAPRMIPKVAVYVEYPQPRKVRDISPLGAFIEESGELALGQMLQLTLIAPSVEPLEISAMVRRRETGKGIGVGFARMTQADQGRLHNFLAAITA